MINLGILISGGGSNLQAIIDACESGILKGKAKVAVVISNKPGAYGLLRAKKYGIPSQFVDPQCFPDNKQFCEGVCGELRKYKTDIVCLAGFMRMIDPCLLHEFKGKVLNIHPALLPKFGGKGMYGHYVHEAVIKAGEKESGATVHMVDEVYDHGEVILQKKVAVMPGDAPEALADRVLEVEHDIYPKAIKAVIEKMR